MDIGKFKTDLNRELDGVWVDIGKEARLKIARIGNPAYKETFRRLAKPYQRQIRTGTLSDEVAERILAQSLAESVLLDWEGLEENGKPLPYSKKAALDLLTNPQLKDFRDLVAELANESELFHQQDVDEAEGNLQS